LLASLVSRLIICYVRLTRRIVIRGALPATACVAVSLHRSYWDGPLLCMLDPRITAVTSHAWRSVPGIGWYLANYGVIWTEEDAVENATLYVKDGGICWLAPCGFIRSGGCPHPHSGAAQIARAAGVPIVCVTLSDEGRRWSRLGRRPLTVLIGKPRPTAGDQPVEAITEQLVASLSEQQRRAGRRMTLAGRSSPGGSPPQGRGDLMEPAVPASATTPRPLAISSTRDLESAPTHISVGWWGVRRAANGGVR
jgi:1-acyl-sn-glycerol-3-phosphate acyltransferase